MGENRERPFYYYWSPNNIQAWNKIDGLSSSTTQFRSLYTTTPTKSKNPSITMMLNTNTLFPTFSLSLRYICNSCILICSYAKTSFKFYSCIWCLFIICIVCQSSLKLYFNINGMYWMFLMVEIGSTDTEVLNLLAVENVERRRDTWAIRSF